MLVENSTALKEWAAVCAALAEGRQSLIVRKGGIAEGPGGFRIEHVEFWLFPTQFHQSLEQLTPAGAALLPRVQASAPAAGCLKIDSYAVVKAVAFIDDESRLAQLVGWNIMADDVLRQRFHYRRPGLFVAAVEVFRRPNPVELPDATRYAGCHSWVDLEGPLATAELRPVDPKTPLSSAVRLVNGLAS